MLTLGLRRGEALGLRWGDVDLDRATLTVRCQLQRVNGAWALVEPKSRESQRTLPLPAFLIDVLRAHHARQVENRLALGGAWVEHDLVFPSGAGTPMEGRNLLRDFLGRLRQSGLGHLTIHGLRHGAGKATSRPRWPSTPTSRPTCCARTPPGCSGRWWGSRRPVGVRAPVGVRVGVQRPETHGTRPITDGF